MTETAIRSFIAIPLSSEIHKKLHQVSDTLRKNLFSVPVRWVNPDNIHLTLKFLGDVSLSNLEILQNILASEVNTYSQFEISVGELGAFPNPRRPRILWIGVESPPELKAMQISIETSLERLGYPREDRPFSPHLTLGRLNRKTTYQDFGQVTKVLSTINVGFLGADRVKEVNLYRSDLKPGGAIYTRLFTAHLNTNV
jgi:2'-5' RNA ligase